MDATTVATTAGPTSHVVIDLAGLERLVDLLAREHTVIGPTVRDGAVVLAPVTRLEDLPAGRGDEQAPGRYRLRERDDDLVFGWATATTGAKPWLHPALDALPTEADPDGGAPLPCGAPDGRPLAFLGLRACDVAAIALQDRVLAGRAIADPRYLARRADAFVVAVTCTVGGGTCFCASTGSGPEPATGYDVRLAEVLDDAGHRFVATAGTPAGTRLLARVGAGPASPEDVATVARRVRAVAAGQVRHVELPGLRERLYAAAAHPHWADVGRRCLACGGCTMVCPTCFCTSVRDDTDPVDGAVGRTQVWDSCFSADFSSVHGPGPIRASTAARYRQWATHKFAAWSDQFGALGCVGCGRCVTWCPVGIDVTEEVAAVAPFAP